MPVREIKTTLSLDGEKQFKQELADASRQMRVMNADLKAMAAAFESTDDAQRYYTQRSETLNNKVAQQKEIVRALTDAMKRSVDVYGDAAKETDGYRIKLSNATEQLFRMEKEAEEAARELEDLGRDSNRIGRQIETGIGDAAEDASEKLDGMFDKVAGDIESIRGSATFSVFSDVTEGVTGAIAGLDQFAESTREYRRSVSFLEQNAKTYGLDFATMKDQMIEVATVTGDVESAIEAVSNLMATGLNGEEVAAAVDLIAGAVIRFPDTLTFESLADSLQETIATGEATGQYAELLERLGISLEDVNKAFSDVETAENRQQVALAYLTENGMATYYRQWQDANSELTTAEEATLKLNDAIAGFGTVVDRYMAPAKLKIADTLTGITTLFTEGAEAAYGMSDEDFWKETAKKTGSIRHDSAEAPGFWESIQNIGSGIVEMLIPSAGAEELAPEYGEYGAQAFSAFETGMQTAAEESTAGVDAANALVSDMESANGNAQTAGKNAMIYYANGIADGAPYVYRNLQTVMDSINSILNSAAVPSWGGGVPSTSGGANPNTTVSERGTAVLQIDGQTAGRLLYSGVSSAGARKVQTKMIVR